MLQVWGETEGEMSEWIATHGLSVLLVLSVACAFLLLEVVRCWVQLSHLEKDLECERQAAVGWTRQAHESRGKVDELRDRLKYELSTQGGWENEAIFWRRHFDKDACEYVNNLEGDDNE